MRLGQTSVIHFLSRLGSSIVGFLATVYIARSLGSELLGIYFLTLALVGWLKIANVMGINAALTKRISEGAEKNYHVSAGLILSSAIFITLSSGVYLSRGLVNSYLGRPLYGLVILLFGVQVAYSYVGAVIQGEHLVHLYGLMGTAQTVIRVGLQVAAVYLGYELIGLLISEAVGFAVMTVVGSILLLRYYDRTLFTRLPEKRHFKSILDFAKYSWVSNLQGKTYNLMDKIILGIFVSSELVGIYSVSWNIAMMLALFSKSIGASLFPEMSKLSTGAEMEKVGGHLEDTLAYSGLIAIPGFLGSVLVGNGVLNIYGSEFQQGQVVLVLLVGATVFHSYYAQFINTLDAIDRPDISFQVNLFFVLSNIGLNVVLIYLYGWIGAAVATMISVLLTSVLCYWMTNQLVTFSIPYREISRQVVAATVMAGFVFASRRLLETYGVDTERVVPVLVLIGLGASVYFVFLLGISTQFRAVIVDNMPRTLTRSEFR